VNKIQKAIAWVLQKATGYPPWNVSSPMPTAYSQFFAGQNGLDAMDKLSVVYTCCNLLGRLGATFPIDIVESDGEISQPVDNYISGLFTQPNEYMDKVQFLEAFWLSFGLYGNAYAEIVRVGNRITSLWPLPFERVRPKFENQNLWYEVTLPSGEMARLEPRQMLHVRNFSLDGINGLSPLRLHAIRRGIAAAEFQDGFLKNGARPSLVFTSKTNPSLEAQDRLRETAERLYSGPENIGKIMMLFGDADVKTVSLSPADAQLIETAGMSVAEIAAAYGVPMNLLNITDKTSTYASAEWFDIEFVKYTIRPMCVRFASEFTSKLLNPRLSQSIKFNLNSLLEGQPKSQAEMIRTYVAAGVMTPNEARAKLNLKPLPGGDVLISQSNQAPIEMLDEINKPQPKLPAPPNQADGGGKGNPSGVDWQATTKAINDVLWKASIR
jgi:HK97 family phage portal protein